MGHRLSKIATRTGDSGTSGLADGSRLPKTDARFTAMGDVDELNSHVGMLRAHGLPAAIDAVLEDVQHRLFDIGGELALPGHRALDDTHVLALDQALADLNATLPPLKEFILPGGSPAAASAHLARAVARRAERTLWRMHQEAPLANDTGLRYLNRLSDLMFVIARQLGRGDNAPESTWRKNG